MHFESIDFNYSTAYGVFQFGNIFRYINAHADAIPSRATDKAPPSNARRRFDPSTPIARPCTGTIMVKWDFRPLDPGTIQMFIHYNVQICTYFSAFVCCCIVLVLCTVRRAEFVQFNIRLCSSDNILNLDSVREFSAFVCDIHTARCTYVLFGWPDLRFCLGIT